MKCFAFSLVAVAVALLGNVGLAQEAAGIPENIIKELDHLVGTWQVEGKVGEEEQTGGFTCRWARGKDKKKCCIVGRFSYKTGDEVTSGVTLIGWNAAKECIEDRGFDTSGGNSTLFWTVESATLWQGELIRVEDGKEVKGKIHLVKKGASEIVYEADMEDGETARVVFRKVKGGASGESPSRENTCDNRLTLSRANVISR